MAVAEMQVASRRRSAFCCERSPQSVRTASPSSAKRIAEKICLLPVFYLSPWFVCRVERNSRPSQPDDISPWTLIVILSAAKNPGSLFRALRSAELLRCAENDNVFILLDLARTSQRRPCSRYQQENLGRNTEKGVFKAQKASMRNPDWSSPWRRLLAFPVEINKNLVWSATAGCAKVAVMGV